MKSELKQFNQKISAESNPENGQNNNEILRIHLDLASSFEKQLNDCISLYSQKGNETLKNM